jgi:hypothetical protein
VWTPAGYLFVDGFWDYELAQRGVLFAPVSFRRGYHGWGFSYTPSVVLNTRRLTEFLFVNSPCGCYCFGDYFEPSHVQAGIFPWFAFHLSSLGYDPFFAFSSWAHHKDAGWHERLITDFRAFRDDARLRPPRTLDDLLTRGRRSGERSESLALPFSRFVARTDSSSMRFENLSAAEHGEIRRSRHHYYRAASERFEFETRFTRNEPSRAFDRNSRFTDERRDDRRDSRITDDRRDDRRESRLTDDRRESKDGRRPVSQPADLYLHNPRGRFVDANDRPEGKSAEGKGESRFTEDRRESDIEKDGKKSRFADDRGKSKIADDRRAPRTMDDRGKSKIAEDQGKSKIAEDRREFQTSRNLTTTRTPPVVSRRPVSTAGLEQRGIQESPAQRLANPKFVPQASNRGRSESTQKESVRGGRSIRH